MKTQSLRDIGTDELQSKIKIATKELDRLKQELKHRIEGLSASLSDHAVKPKRQMTLTPLHREISRTVQTLRHAKKRGAPKADIAKLEKQLKRQQGELRKQNG